MTQPTFEELKPTKLQVQPSRPKPTKGFPLEFKLKRRMVQELGSSVKRSRDLTTQTSTPKFVEKVIMKVDNVIELFQTMAIVTLNMGNLALEVNTLKNILAMGEKVML